MSISFDRGRFQTSYENLLGIATVNELESNKVSFKQYNLTQNDTDLLMQELMYDGEDYLFSGMVSLAEAIDGVFLKRFSWATVKLYYSIYYMLRASLAAKGIGILRNASMYRLKVAIGESPFSTNNKKYNSTHDGTINHYKDLYQTSDILLTNNIEDVDVYTWMKDIREIINYRSRVILDPEYLSVWEKFNTALDDNSMSILLSELEADEYINCFQEEYAIMAIPIKRAILTLKDFNERGFINEDLKIRMNYIKRIMKYNERNIGLFMEFF